MFWLFLGFATGFVVVWAFRDQPSVFDAHRERWERRLRPRPPSKKEPRDGGDHE